MTPEYILRKSLCRPASCGSGNKERDLQHATDALEYMSYANTYAEQGYHDPKKGILFSNWNYFSRDAIRLLEEYGYETEWDDEWYVCECGAAFRTQPNCYSWQPSYAEVDGEMWCLDCALAHAEEYLEGLENKPTKALNITGINPEDYGYTRLDNEYESGLYGTNDDPEKIFKSLAPYHSRILFQIDSVEQFRFTFVVWVKEDNE